MATITRNKGCIPQLNEEGCFVKPLVQNSEKFPPKNPFHRIYCHNTLSSARRSACFQPNRNLIPHDSLDYALSAIYNHSTELFPEVTDPYYQPETIGELTWRRLRNVSIEKPKEGPRISVKVLDRKEDDQKQKITLPYRYMKDHDLIIGGVVERNNPNCVKLINSSHHLPQTNAGYSRQEHGTIYQY